MLAGLTHEVPLAVGDVAAGVRLLHLQVQGPPSVRPGPELELAMLHVEGEPADVDGAGALENAWQGDREKGTESLSQAGDTERGGLVPPPGTRAGAVAGSAL